MRVGSVPTEQQLRDRLQIHKHVKSFRRVHRNGHAVQNEKRRQSSRSTRKKLQQVAPWRNASRLSWVGAILRHPRFGSKTLIRLQRSSCYLQCAIIAVVVSAQTVLANTSWGTRQRHWSKVHHRTCGLRPHVGHPQTDTDMLAQLRPKQWPPEQASCMKHSYSRRNDTAPFSMPSPATHAAPALVTDHIAPATQTTLHPKTCHRAVHRGTPAVFAARSTCVSRCGIHGASASRGVRVAITYIEHRDSTPG